jgi:hypothetical protein
MEVTPTLTDVTRTVLANIPCQSYRELIA